MNKDLLKSELLLRNVNVNDEQLDNLFSFMKLTLETNEKFNLTAIKDEDQFVEKMIFDSALAVVGNDLSNLNVIDLGTGAGFPGMVLYFLNPSINLTLLDSSNKKINYLAENAKNNNYSINCVCDRAENFAKQNIEKYDYAFARAVAPLSILVELVAPILKIGGYFVAMKGPGAEEEIEEASKAIKKLGLKLVKIYNDTLPISKEERNLIYIIKEKKTDTKYPREYSEIKKRHL